MQFAKGQIGAIIIIIAIVGTVFGGFMLNVNNVYGCTTNYKYITDVAGAFSGTSADMEIDYNPYANITGYTVYDPTGSGGNLDYVHGISYTQSKGSSGYWIETLSGDVEMYPLYIHSDTDSTQASVTYKDYTYTFTEVQNAGHYHVAKTPFSYSTYSNLEINGVTFVGINLITLQEVMSALFGSGVSKDIDKFVISIDSRTVNGYPGFIGGLEYRYKETITDKNHIFTAGYNSLQVVVYPKTKSCEIAGKSGVSWDDIYLAWGEKDYDASVSILGTSGGQHTNSYIDPASGVMPISEHVTRAVSVYEQSFADKLHWSAIFAPQSDPPTGSIYYQYHDSDTGTDKTVKMVDWKISPNLDDLPTVHFTYQAWFYNKDGSKIAHAISAYDGGLFRYFTIDAQLSLSDGVWSQFSIGVSDGSSVHYEGLIDEITTPLAGNASSVKSDMSSVTKLEGSNLQTMTYTLDGKEHVETSGNTSYTQSVSESKWVTKKITYDTDSTYWYNGYDVASASIVFPKTSFGGDVPKGTDVFKIFWNNADGGYLYSDVTVELKDDGWYVNTIPIGNWPAISVRIYKDLSGTPYLGVIPIQAFNNFLDYSKLDVSEVPIGLAVTDNNGKEIVNYKLTSFKMLLWDCTKTVHRHEVVDTVLFLPSGGLYTQDGVFNEVQSFPNDILVKLRIMSAAHVGDGITITNSAGESVYFATDHVANWITEDGKSCAFADLSVIYVDKSVPAVSIDGKEYRGGLYYTAPDGSVTFLEKGYLYYQFGTTGDIVRVGTSESTNDWSVTLNGVWAMSTSYSTGENVAEAHMEWNGLGGIWGWTSIDTVLMFSGISMALLVLCAWRYELTGLDWILGLCAVLFPVIAWL